METKDYNYYQTEILRAIKDQSPNFSPTMKIIGSNGSSKWLNIPVNKIKEIVKILAD